MSVMPIKYVYTKRTNNGLQNMNILSRPDSTGHSYNIK